MPYHSKQEVLATIARRSVVNANGCALWQGMTNHKGYGMIRCGGLMMTVHRAAYTLRHGPIPDGMHVLHKCDQRTCSTDECLFLGTNTDNIADKCAKDRSGRKLTIDKVREIRLLAESGITHRELAGIFAVNTSNISRAISGERWAHVVRQGGV